jgi:phosphatidate cytidylyltransferase
MLAHRLATGLTLVAAFLAVLILDEFLAPWFPLWLVTVTIVITLGSRELVGLLGETSAKPSGNAVLGGVLLLVVANWLPHVVDEVGRRHFSPNVEVAHDPLRPITVMGWPLWGFVSVVMVTFVSQGVQFRKGRATMATISGTILAIAYIGLLGGFIIQMRWLEGRFHGLIPLATLVAAAKGSDTGAYTLGRLAGRNKLWPTLSPNKTVEGAVGGVIFGIGFVLVITAVARYLLHAQALSWVAAVGFGAVVSLAAMLGDLMESMIKRDCARKDASATLPGFGGVLDLIDSLLFAGPVGYGFWLWFA